MSNHEMMGPHLNLFNGGLTTDPRFNLFYGKIYMELLIYVFWPIDCLITDWLYIGDSHGRDRMVVGFKTTNAISVYHH